MFFVLFIIIIIFFKQPSFLAQVFAKALLSISLSNYIPLDLRRSLQYQYLDARELLGVNSCLYLIESNDRRNGKETNLVSLANCCWVYLNAAKAKGQECNNLTIKAL